MIDAVSPRTGWIIRVASDSVTAPAASQANTEQADFGAILGSGVASRKTEASKAAETADATATSSADTLASVLASANATAAAATATPEASGTTSASTTKPGVMALVQAMMNGSFQASYETDAGKLTETDPNGTDIMPSNYYASDACAAQMAQLLGGKVVQLQPFHTSQIFVEPKANFIQLSNGQTFNAADVAYYARYSDLSQNQMIACVTQTINQGAAWTSYNQNGAKGNAPEFALGYVGPPISGMDYPAGMVGADGNVVNPVLQSVAT